MRSRSFTFKVAGDPKGKQRPRSARNGHFYTPRETHIYEDLVRYNAKAEYMKVNQNTKPLECPVAVEILAVYKIPKSYSKKRKEACLAGLELPAKKVDIDNIIKIILDGLNPKKKGKYTLVEGIYKDDKQVVACHATKKYGLDPQVKVKVSWNE